MSLYNSNVGDEIIEIRIRDSTGRRIDKFVFKARDKYAAQKILSCMMEKYALMGNDNYFESS